MLPLEIMLPIDFTAVLCWAQHHCTVLHLVGVLHWCCPILWGTTSSSPPQCPQCCTHVQYCTILIIIIIIPILWGMLHWGWGEHAAWYRRYSGWVNDEEVVIGQVVESLALFFDFWIFVSLKCPFGPPKSKFAKIAIFRKFSEIFANFGQFSPFLAIFDHLGLPPEHSGPKNENFWFRCEKIVILGAGPAGPGALRAPGASPSSHPFKFENKLRTFHPQDF